MMQVSIALLRLAVVVAVALGLVMLDARTVVPFAVLGFFLLAAVGGYLRSRRPRQTWECNDEP